MRALLLILAAVIPLLPAPGRQPSPERDALLVSTSWLAAHLKDPDLVLLHVGEKASYDRGHIPGARFVDFHQVLHWDDNGRSLQMPPADVLRQRLAALGLSTGSRAVVYQSDGWTSVATRVVLTLDYAGLTRVSLLDGGMPVWTREQRPTSVDTPPVRTASLGALSLRPVIVDAHFVDSHRTQPGFAVVDARAASFYDGIQTGGMMLQRHKTGHIAGARSIPFNSVQDAEGRLKPAAELARLFAAAGIKPGDTIIAYCHIGQQATAVLFAARTLGHKVLLYDGSFEDWSARNLPVETSARRGAK